MKILKTIFILLLLTSFPFVATAQERISRIDVVGNERMEKGFVLNSVKIKEGEPYSDEKLRDDLKNIYRTGYFSDVQVDVKDSPAGKLVTFVVVERPPIKAIYVTGNKKIKTADITDKLKVRTNTVLNTDRVKESIDEIRKLYASKAFYSTRINHAIEYPEANEAVVTFAIEEPEAAYVRKIAFTGNKVFKEGTLKDYMRTKEKGWLSWFTGSGILDDENLEQDRKNLEGFYADNGYVRSRVGVPDVQISQDGKSIQITIPIDEGNPYKIKAIDFKGDVIFTHEELMKNMKSRPGETFRVSLFQEDILMLTDMYQDKGYAFCDITPLSPMNDDEHTVSLTYNVEKGREIFVNRISILGNVKTRDKVVRREMRIAEGDRFSATGLKNSKRNLKNTTFFKEVDMKILKTEEPDKVNLDVAVEERPTGSISVGVGYSSAEQAILSGTIAQENFLGTGRKLFLEAALSTYTHEFKFSYLEPYIFDLNLHAGFNIFNFERYMDTYDYKKTGGGVSLIRPLTEYVRAGMKYRFETVDVTNIDAAASTYIKEQEGSSTTSSVTWSLTKNTIDDVLNPTKGINSELSFELAGGVFGGTNDFYRSVGSYGRYFPIKFLDSAIFLRGTAGVIRAYSGKTIPIYEKFYVGGLNTVRGFKYGEAGPKDETDEVIGGKNQLYFNTEWIFPIYKPAGIKGVVFYDVGHGFDDSKGFLLDGVRHGAGVGIRWFSPLGPIRLELGFNLAPKEGEKRSVFEFAIGTQY